MSESEENKKRVVINKEKKFLSNTTYLMTVLLAVFVGMYIYIDNKVNIVDYSQKFSVPETDLLTQEEVLKERNVVRQYQKKPTLVSAQNNSIPITESDDTESDDTESSDNTNESNDDQKQIDTTKSIKAKTYLIDESQLDINSNNVFQKQNQVTQETYIKEGTGLSLATNDRYDLNDKKISQMFSGSIYAIDVPEKELLLSISNDSGLATIQIDSDTKIQINGERITIRDLKIGDKITAEGLGYIESNKIKASVVTLTGFTTIVSIN